MGGKQFGVPGSKSVHDPKPRQELISSSVPQGWLLTSIFIKDGDNETKLAFGKFTDTGRSVDML